MKPVFLLLNSVLLSLLLAVSGAALAASQVDINSADAAQLHEGLVGIGPSKAEAIVEYRKAHGPFRSADELVNVKGIGLRTVERNRDLIMVGKGASPSGKPAATAEPARAGAQAGAAPAPVARR